MDGENEDDSGARILTCRFQARSEGGSTGSIEPPLSRQQYMYTCNCCGRSCKLPNISVKIQLNLHQNEPFQVKKSQNFPGRGHSPSPEPLSAELEPFAAAIKASDRNQPLS